MKRAYRRWKTFCKLQKAIVCVNQRLKDHVLLNHNITEHARRVRDNLTDCSCQMCRNERHCDWLNNNDKLTIQERKHKAQYNDWYKN